MKKMKLFYKLTLLAVVSLTIVSCSSTTVLSSWCVENPPKGVMNKVLVLGVTSSQLADMIGEEAMVHSLKDAGVNASTARSVFGVTDLRGISEEQITKKLKEENFSSVMILTVIDKQREQKYVPGSTYMSPYYGYRGYYSHYTALHGRVYSQGYYETVTNYILEADLYDIHNVGTMLYSAQTKTYNLESGYKIADQFSKKVVGEMKSKGILKK